MLGRLMILMVVMSSALQAVDLGVHGTLFPIFEVSFLEAIQTRLKTLEKQGKLTHLQRVFALKAEERVLRPQSSSQLPQTQTYSAYLYNPEFTAEHDYQDHKGVVFFKKGQRINPLNSHSWGEPLLLIDGDDEQQIKWIHHQKGKIVLIQGSPIALEKQIKRAVYFDQGGTTVKRFTITSVPAKITQKDKHLLVEMIPIDMMRNPA